MNPFRLSTRLVPGGRTPVDSARAGPVSVVPWRVVERSSRGVIEIEHSGTEPLRAVRFALAGGGMLGLSLPRTVYPGERLRVVVRGIAARGAAEAADAMLVLRWFTFDGTELLWPVAL